VSLPGSQAGGAITSRSELKSLTQTPVAEKRWTALLRGRRLRLPWRIASGSWQPMRAECQHGKESVANSHPPFSPCSVERQSRDFMFFCLGCGIHYTRSRCRLSHFPCPISHRSPTADSQHEARLQRAPPNRDGLPGVVQMRPPRAGMNQAVGLKTPARHHSLVSTTANGLLAPCLSRSRCRLSHFPFPIVAQPADSSA